MSMADTERGGVMDKLHVQPAGTQRPTASTRSSLLAGKKHGMAPVLSLVR